MKTIEQKYMEALEKIIELQETVQSLEWILNNPEESLEIEPITKFTSKRNDLN